MLPARPAEPLARAPPVGRADLLWNDQSADRRIAGLARDAAMRCHGALADEEGGARSA